MRLSSKRISKAQRGKKPCSAERMSARIDAAQERKGALK